MQSNQDQATRQLFHFAAPNLHLPGVELAVAALHVLEVGEIPPPTAVPFAPPLVLGLSRWRDNIVTVLSMAALLDGQADPNGTGEGSQRFFDQRCLIAQILVDGQQEFVAWPVLPGAGSIDVSRKAPRAEIPAGLPADIIHAAIKHGERVIVLLNMENLASHIYQAGVTTRVA